MVGGREDTGEHVNLSVFSACMSSADQASLDGTKVLAHPLVSYFHRKAPLLDTYYGLRVRSLRDEKTHQQLVSSQRCDLARLFT